MPSRRSCRNKAVGIGAIIAAQRVFDDARESHARRSAAVDAAIDREVYALYGLTEEEIAQVEGQR
jgi:hypothetical protein